MEKKDEVFVISQIGDEGSPIRKRADVIADLIVKPVASEFNQTILRSDRDYTPGPITPQLLKSILTARIVVADLTGKNPNVYYELAFAQSFGVPVVMLVDKTSSLPFDVKDERMITIGDSEGTVDMPAGEEAKRKLREMFRIVLDEGYKPYSIVNEVASVQNIESMSPADPVASELAALNRRMDQVQELVSSSTSRANSTFRVVDVRQLMKFVETYATQHQIVNEVELDELITDQTSYSFDEWVRDLVQKLPDERRKPTQDFDDIPF